MAAVPRGRAMFRDPCLADPAPDLPPGTRGQASMAGVAVSNGRRARNLRRHNYHGLARTCAGTTITVSQELAPAQRHGEGEHAPSLRARRELRASFLAKVDLSTNSTPRTAHFEPLNWLIRQPTRKTNV